MSSATNALIFARSPNRDCTKAWVPVYEISDMLAFRLAGKQPEAWARFCVSNNTIFHWDGRKKSWVRCTGEIRKIEGVSFLDPVLCEERVNDD